jgi:prevent-host-death family protein
MTTVSVAELKARLSEFLALVRGGDDVVVTDRGRPIARLTGLGPDAADARIAELVRAGSVRPARRSPGTRGASAEREPAQLLSDPNGRLLRALLEEREDGR